MNIKLTLQLFIVMLFVFGLTGTASAQTPQTITVFAASSLTDAFIEIKQQFEATHPAIEVVYNFGGSSTLAAQLSEGAPADVFASANSNQMQAAQAAGRISGEPVIFARNRLVLVVPADNPANVTTLDELATPGIKLVLAAPEVPVRQYTDNMLNLLAEDAAFGETYRSAVMDNIVSEEGNVRQVLLKVLLGEADAAIVYSSDVTRDALDSVLQISIPDAVNTLAAYPIAITDDSAQAEQAQAFVDFVLSTQGQAIISKWGLIPVSAQKASAHASETVPANVGVMALIIFIFGLLSG